LRNIWKAAAVVAVFASGALPAAAQHRSVAENSLVGVRLFDSGLKLLTMFGEPDEIDNAGGGGGGAAPGPSAPVGFTTTGGGAGMMGGRPGAGGGNMGGHGLDTMAAAAAARAAAEGRGQRDSGMLPGDPFGFTDQIYFVPPGAGGGGGGRRGGGMGDPNAGMRRGPSGNSGFGGGDGGGNAAPAVSSGGGPAVSSDSYARWVYKRDGGKYGFIVDKDNQVIQIEAVALKDTKAVTKKGLTFGATFLQVIKVYGWPDSYEVAGNTITMRYLLKNHVIFRLNRLGLDQPHVVTGILIAAAKS